MYNIHIHTSIFVYLVISVSYHIERYVHTSRTLIFGSKIWVLTTSKHANLGFVLLDGTSCCKIDSTKPPLYVMLVGSGTILQVKPARGVNSH